MKSVMNPSKNDFNCRVKKSFYTHSRVLLNTFVLLITAQNGEDFLLYEWMGGDFEYPGTKDILMVSAVTVVTQCIFKGVWRK